MPGPDTYYIIGKMHIECVIPFIWSVNVGWKWGKYVFPVPPRLKSHPGQFWTNPCSLQHAIKPRPSAKKKLYLTTENNHSFLCVYNWGQPLKDNRRDWSGLVNCLWVCAPCLDSKAEIPCCCPGDESWINRENMTLRLFTLQATVVHGKWEWKFYVELFWRTEKVLLVALSLLSFHLSIYFHWRNIECVQFVKMSSSRWDSWSFWGLFHGTK